MLDFVAVLIQLWQLVAIWAQPVWQIIFVSFDQPFHPLQVELARVRRLVELRAAGRCLEVSYRPSHCSALDSGDCIGLDDVAHGDRFLAISSSDHDVASPGLWHAKPV